MKLIKKAIYVFVFTIVFSTTFQCASTKNTLTFQEEPPFKVKPIAFQEWYAGIKIGGTGINLFVPISNEEENISIENIYFRNLQGRLVKQDGEYKAILKNPSKSYTFTTPEKPLDYPFTLAQNECVISYIQNGQTKYYKITELNEFAGIYYENGPPSIYVKQRTSGLATLDEENDD